MPLYTKPRWEEAPKGTTGFLPETEEFWACWVNKVGDIVRTANAQHGPQEFEYDNKSCHPSWTSRRNIYIPRPEQERPEPDWSKAPEGTTGFVQGRTEPYWVRIEENQVYVCRVSDTTKWQSSSYHDTDWWKERKHLYIPRPSVEPVEPSAPVTEESYFTHDWTAL